MGRLKLSDSFIMESNGASWSSNTNLPKGSILQMVYNTTTTEKATTSSSYQSWDGLAANITPIRSDSHLRIYVNAVRCLCQANSNNIYLRITDGTNATDVWKHKNYDTDGNYEAVTPCHNWYWPIFHTAGTQITLTPELLSLDNSNNVIWGDNGSTSHMIVQEIAQ